MSEPEICGATTSIEMDGAVISLGECTKPPGHDGPDHSNATASWGDDSLPHPLAS